eukprot:SAG22_NODE_1303_length_4797_cov_2976.784376_8_plen_56_part_00
MARDKRTITNVANRVDRSGLAALAKAVDLGDQIDDTTTVDAIVKLLLEHITQGSE